MVNPIELTHLGLVVKDMKKTVVYYESLGIGVSDGQAFAYFDTCESGGEIMVKLVQSNGA